MDGWEVLKALKTDPTTRDIPVVVFSAKTNVFEKIRSLKEGAVHYITKPFSYQQLVSSLEAILNIEK